MVIKIFSKFQVKIYIRKGVIMAPTIIKRVYFRTPCCRARIHAEPVPIDRNRESSKTGLAKK